MNLGYKYARIERERRFLIDQFPSHANVTRTRRILDRYIDGTSLRLRQQCDSDNPVVFKLTQKVPKRSRGAQQGFITSMVLSQEEFRVFAQLPAKTLTKVRYSVPPFGIDVFEGSLKGLVLDSREELVQASRQDLQNWLAEYRINFGR
jgi:CYTH domain-containing protein